MLAVTAVNVAQKAKANRKETPAILNERYEMSDTHSQIFADQSWTYVPTFGCHDHCVQ